MSELDTEFSPPGYAIDTPGKWRVVVAQEQIDILRGAGIDPLRLPRLQQTTVEAVVENYGRHGRFPTAVIYLRGTVREWGQAWQKAFGRPGYIVDAPPAEAPLFLTSCLCAHLSAP